MTATVETPAKFSRFSSFAESTMTVGRRLEAICARRWVLALAEEPTTTNISHLAASDSSSRCRQRVALQIVFTIVAPG